MHVKISQALCGVCKEIWDSSVRSFRSPLEFWANSSLFTPGNPDLVLIVCGGGSGFGPEPPSPSTPALLPNSNVNPMAEFLPALPCLLCRRSDHSSGFLTLPSWNRSPGSDLRALALGFHFRRRSFLLQLPLWLPLYCIEVRLTHLKSTPPTPIPNPSYPAVVLSIALITACWTTLCLSCFQSVSPDKWGLRR